MKRNCLTGLYKTITSRRSRSSRVKYILIFTVAAIFLTTYFSSITYEIIFSRVTEGRYPEHGLNSSLSAKSVFFLKVHKSASSTVQNILMRYGLKHGLNFALPYSSNYLGHPAPLSPGMALPLAPGAHYHVLCHHARYSRRWARGLLAEGAALVTMVRDPASLFESLFSYFELQRHYQLNLTQLASMPGWWLRTCGRYYGRVGLNQMTFDLGLDERHHADRPRLRRFLAELDDDFDLVMVAEHFDESLVLLKQLLRLDMEDVVYVEHNRRLPWARSALGPDERRRLSRANHADQMLYDHFLDVFRRKMADFGTARMRAEVARLRAARERAANACSVQRVDNRRVPEVIFRELSDKVTAVRVPPGADDFCRDLAKSEMPFTSQLRRRHLRTHGSAWLNFLYAVGYYQI